MKKLKKISLVLSICSAMTFMSSTYIMADDEKIDIEATETKEVADEEFSEVDIETELNILREFFKEKGIDSAKVQTMEEIDPFSLELLYKQATEQEFSSEQIDQYIDGLIKSTPEMLESIDDATESELDDKGNIITPEGEIMPNTNKPPENIRTKRNALMSADNGDVKSVINTRDPGVSWLVYSNHGYNSASSYLELPRVEDINTKEGVTAKDVPYMFFVLNSDTGSTYGDYGVYYDSDSGYWKGFYNAVFRGVNYSYWESDSIPVGSRLYFNISITYNGYVRFRITNSDDHSQVFYDKSIDHRGTVRPDGRNAQFAKAVTIAQHLDSSGKLNTVTGAKMYNAKYFNSYIYNNYGNSPWNDSNVNRTIRQAPTYNQIETVRVNSYEKWDKEDISIMFLQDEVFTLNYDGNGNTSGTAPEDTSGSYPIYNSATVLDKGDLEKSGHVFKGWSTNKDSTTAEYQSGSNIVFNESMLSNPNHAVTLYAIWEEEEKVVPPKPNEDDLKKQYTVKYNSNASDSKGVVPVDSKKYKNNEEVSVLSKGSLSRKNYTFKNWNTKSDGSGKSYKSGEKFNIEKNTTLYAQWSHNDSEILDKSNHSSYLNGYSDNTIRPEGKVSRAEVSAMYFRVMTDQAREKYWKTENGYSDVLKSAWYNGEISTLSNMKVIKGYEDGSFRPDGDITRAEFATITAKFLTDSSAESLNSNFNDTNGHWAENDIKKLASKGIIKGYSDGGFRPDSTITRAEASKIMNGLLERKPNKERLLGDVKNWRDNPYEAWYYGDIQEASNSHKYYIDSANGLEVWTELTPDRDWTIYKNSLNEKL